VVTAAGGVMASETLGEQLELSTCLCAAPAAGMSALMITIDSAKPATARDTKCVSALIIERNPGLRLPNAYIFIGTTFLEQKPCASHKVDGDDFRSHSP